jgi:hypothetical protein
MLCTKSAPTSMIPFRLHVKLNTSKFRQLGQGLVLAKSRRQMSGVSAIDSRVFRNLFGTDQIRKVGD